MTRNPVLTARKVYTNRNGEKYRCTAVLGQGKASFQRVTDCWSFIACGIVSYDDGTLEWDYSYGGHWPW